MEITDGKMIIQSPTGLFEIESAVSRDKLEALVSEFEPHAIEAKRLIDEAQTIAVHGEDDTAGMSAARAKAKEIVAAIKNLDETHKREKFVARQITTTVDGLRKQIKDRLTTIKEELRHMADTAKRAEQERREALAKERRELLEPHMMAGDVIASDLGAMDDQTFDTILEAQKAKKIAAEQQARIAELEAKEREREAQDRRREEIEAAKEEARKQAEADAQRKQEAIRRENEELKARQSEPAAPPVDAETLPGYESGLQDGRKGLAAELIAQFADSMDAVVIEFLESEVG